MAAQATGTFTVLSWDEDTYAELGGGAKLTKATVTFGFEGDVTAQGTWNAVMCYRTDKTAVYTGMQQMAGQVAGQDGTFVLRADGEFVDGEARTQWQVIEGAGTGALAGLTGSGSAVAAGGPGGKFTFDYDLS